MALRQPSAAATIYSLLARARRAKATTAAQAAAIVRPLPALVAVMAVQDGKLVAVVVPGAQFAVKFMSSLNIPLVDYLVVAGSGGSSGGGGGAGGVLQASNVYLATGSYAVTVGAFGSGQGANTASA